MARSTGIPVKGTQAVLYAPTESVATWRIAYIDRATGKRKITTGGKVQEKAEEKARHLSGEFIEGWSSDSPPTVKEAVALWLNAHRSDWSSRTYDQYYYFGKKLIDPYGDRLVTHISPLDLSKLDLATHSRGQQEKARSLVRGIFGHCSVWVSKERADQLAKGIMLSGNAGAKRNPRVDRGDIPSSKLVASLIVTAYHTLQIGPLDEMVDETFRTVIDPITGAKERIDLPDENGLRGGAATINRGLAKPDPNDSVFRNGLPLEVVKQHRRGMPKHYSNPEGRRRNETAELAGRYRQVGLATTLGAGGGLRIGEVLALRVRHFFSEADIQRIFTADWARIRSGYRGVLDVSEQASQASRGAIWVSGTKGATKSRIVNLPAFLPSWHETTQGTTREQIGRVVPRLSDPSISLWEATDEESILLWEHGFTPLGYLLWDHLWDGLWNSPAIAKHGYDNLKRISEFREMLLFPTRNRVRPGPVRGEVQTDPSWRNSTRIVEGTGNYQSQTNYARISNPLYDFVEAELNESPRHRTNVEGRKGWTHHGLRHWAVSSRIKAGVPLPLIAKEMGHKDSSFTLERYGHVLDGGVTPQGFEY